MAMVTATATITPAGTITCRSGCDFDLITGQNIEQAVQINEHLYSLEQGPFVSEFVVQTPLPGGALLFGSALILALVLMGGRKA